MTSQMVSAHAMYLVALGWLALNATIFYSFRAQLQSERRIFTFQVCAFAIYSATVLLLWLRTDASAPALLGLVSAHAIYSLTFLWLWSGTQGSYSVAILKSLLQSPAPRSKLIEDLRHIGERKKRGRLGSLNRLGLIALEKEYYRVTLLGKIAANALLSLRWLANCKVGG